MSHVKFTRLNADPDAYSATMTANNTSGSKKLLVLFTVVVAACTRVKPKFMIDSMVS